MQKTRNNESSNFQQILQQRCALLVTAQNFMGRARHVNEMLEQMATFIQRDLDAVTQNSDIFGLMSDETADVTGV